MFSIFDLYNPETDAHLAIRGYFYQLFHTINAWLDLDDEHQLGIECAEDLVKISQVLEIHQIKHSKKKISLASPSIQKFLVNSFRVWKAENGLSVYYFLTTSAIACDIGLHAPWIKQIQNRDFDTSIGYMRSKTVNLKSPDLRIWNKMIQESDSELRKFLSAVYIKTSQAHYLEFAQEVLQKIEEKYPDQESQRLIEKLMYALLRHASRGGIKILLKKDLDAAIQKVSRETSRTAHKMRNLLGESFIGQMEAALLEDSPDISVNIAPIVQQYMHDITLKRRFHTLLGRAYERIESLEKAQINYEKARSHAMQKEDKIYLEVRILLCRKDVSSIAKATKLAESLIELDGSKREGYYLRLRCGNVAPVVFAKILPKHLHKDPDIVLMLSDSFFKAEKLDDAIDWAKRSGKTQYPTIDKACLISYEIAKYDLHIKEDPRPALKIRKQLAVYKKDLKEIWAKLEGKEFAKHVTAILDLIAILEFVLRDADYMTTIDEAIALSKDKRSSMRQKADFLIALKRLEDAQVLLAKIDSPQVRLEAFVLELQQIESADDTSLDYMRKQAMRLVEEPNVSSDYIQAASLFFLTFIYLNHSQKLKNPAIVNAFLQHISNELRYIFKILQTPSKPLRNKKLIAYVQRLRGAASAKVMLAPLLIEALYASEGYDLLLDIFNLFKNDNFFQVIDRQIIRVAKQSGESQNIQYERILDYVKRFGDIDVLLEEQFILEVEINAKDSQLDILEKMLERSPRNLYLLTQRSKLLIRQKRPVDILQLQELYDINATASVGQGVDIAALLFLDGQQIESLSLLYAMRRQWPGSLLVNQAYLQTAITLSSRGGNAPAAWDDTKTVKDQCRVMLKMHNGAIPDSYILEADMPTTHLKQEEEINQDNPMYAELMGKSIGDKIQGVGEIIEIKHKHVALMNKLLTSSHRYLGDMIIAKAGNEDIEQSLKRLGEILKKQAAGVEGALQWYRDNDALPLIRLASAMSKPLIVMFYYAIQAKDIPIRCASGNLSEHQDVKRILSLIESKKISEAVLDISTILTLNELQLLDSLKDLFDSLLITESTMELLDVWEREIETYTSQKGSQGTLQLRGDQPVLEEESLKESVDILKKIGDLRAWLKQNVEIKSSSAILSMDQSKREQYSDILGRHTLDAFYLAMDKRVLLADEVALRHLAREENDTPTLWVQPVMRLMLERVIITPEQYYACINKLISYGYVHISINAQNLIYETKQSLYASSKLDGFMSILNNSTPDSAMHILAEYLIWLHQEPFLDIQKIAITNHVLDATIGNRPAQLLFLRRLEKGIRQKLSFQPILEGEIMDLMFKWYRMKRGFMI